MTELQNYKVPHMRSMALQLYIRATVFLQRVGTANRQLDIDGFSPRHMLALPYAAALLTHNVAVGTGGG